MRLFWGLAIILGVAFWANMNSPLQGAHTIRQSDTVFAAYSFCVEDASFLKPRIAHRGLSEGVAIGEFPLYSYLLSIPCKIRGSWSEWDPKVFTLFIWILLALVWWQWACVYFRDNEKAPWYFLIFFAFSTQGLLFLPISLPDNLALFLIGFSALLGQNPNTQKLPYKVLSLLLFAMAFAIRPYLIPLAVLVSWDKKFLGTLTVLCVAIYAVWYKWWALQSDVNYYYTAIPSPLEMLTSLPEYLGKLLMLIFREWFHYLFVVLFIIYRKSLKPLELLALAGSLALVILVRGDHVIVHSYYLWAAAIFTFIGLTRTVLEMNPKLQTAALFIFALIGFSQVQHQFHRQAEKRATEVQNLLIEQNVPPEAKIAVAVGEGSCSTQYLYWMKHIGWCIYESEFKGLESCPEGADYILYYKGEKPILSPCTSSPTQKPNDI